MNLNILHIALFPSIKTQEKNICNTWSESRKNKFHIVWLVHPPPCDIHTPLGLPLFLPPLLAPVPPAHTEAPTSSRGHRALTGVTPLPRETPQYPSPWFPGQTDLLHVPTPAGTAGRHSVNGPLARHRPYISIQEIENEVCGLTKKKKKSPNKTQGGKKAFDVNNVKTCVLLSHSGLSGSKTETKYFRLYFPLFADLRPPFDSIALSARQKMAWLLSFIQCTVYPRVHTQPCCAQVLWNISGICHMTKK